ncbi:hypothetical protein PXNS11_150184 [Stutzerimonas xanthomarina]|nr:hypothetical protein PXNS11_150184 [Stutzerimonas xanthomarina]
MLFPSHQPHQLSWRKPVALGTRQTQIRAFARERCEAFSHFNGKPNAKAAVTCAPADGSLKAPREPPWQPQNIGLLTVHTGNIFSADMEAVGRVLSYALLGEHVQDNQLNFLQCVAFAVLQRLKRLDRKVKIDSVGVCARREPLLTTDRHTALANQRHQKISKAHYDSSPCASNVSSSR